MSSRQWLLLTSALVLGAVVGWFIRNSAAPFVLDDPFWREFWSGPPAAGLFAIIAAAIAFHPAHASATVARDNAARDQWWKRAEWALQLAVSDEQADREIAKDALNALSDDATKTELAMIIRVIANTQESADVDERARPRENRGGRFWRWPSRKK